MEKQCFLRKTMVRLKDGKEYAFRAIPFTKRTAPFLETLFNAKDKDDMSIIPALVDLVEMSLSYDNDKETVEYIMDYGLAPLASLPGSEDFGLMQKVMGAMIAQAQADGDNA